MPKVLLRKGCKFWSRDPKTGRRTRHVGPVRVDWTAAQCKSFQDLIQPIPVVPDIKEDVQPEKQTKPELTTEQPASTASHRP